MECCGTTAAQGKASVSVSSSSISLAEMAVILLTTLPVLIDLFYFIIYLFLLHVLSLGQVYSITHTNTLTQDIDTFRLN